MSPIDVFNVVYPYMLAYIAGHGGSILLDKIKSRLHAVRKIVDIMDNAMTDSNVSEADAQATWKITKSLLTKQ
jgi:hypothetical protein